MAKKKATKRSSSRSRSSSRAPDVENPFQTGLPPIGVAPDAGIGLATTGRFIITMKDGSPEASKSLMKMLKSDVGIQASSSSDMSDDASMEEAMQQSGILLENISVAIVEPDPDQVQTMSKSIGNDDSLFVEPEYINYALGLDRPLQTSLDRIASPSIADGTTLDRQYLCGYRAAIDSMLDKMDNHPTHLGPTTSRPSPSVAATWGLQATGVDQSRWTGRGVKIAVLDTGFDLTHPDFAGRSIVSRSFIRGEQVQDLNGHGTHCAGTACGPPQSQRGIRYGIASGANLYIGKVLSNAGRGGDGGILMGIDWAIGQGCQIISMSLGAPVYPGQRPPQSYELAAQRGLQQGTLIIAAAGNESTRPWDIRPVGRPANCNSIVAIGAVDERMRVASFSTRAINPGGGEINFVGPGVDVLSSWPMPRQYRLENGTSMACPHVAGIAALYLEQDPGLDPIALYRAIAGRCRGLPLSVADIGFGLIQSP